MVLDTETLITTGINALKTALRTFIRQGWSYRQGSGDGTRSRNRGNVRRQSRDQTARSLWLAARRDSPLLRHVRLYIAHRF